MREGERRWLADMGLKPIYYWRGEQVSEQEARERVLDAAAVNVRVKMLRYPGAWDASRGYWRKQRAGVRHLDPRLCGAIRVEFERLWVGGTPYP